MKKVFARTGNVIAFTNAMTRLQKREQGIPGMSLVFGEPGLGKTRTALWWAAQEGNGVFIRTKKLMTGRWLLEEIVGELGETPSHRVSDLFRQIRAQLLSRPRTIIIDEVDYLAYDARVLETLRDIHDDTDAPVVMIGMNEADKKLMRYKHLYDRFSEVVPFRSLSGEDVASIADQICEVKLTKDAVAHIHQTANRFRQVMVWLYKAESIARTNNLTQVTADDLSRASSDRGHTSFDTRTGRNVPAVEGGKR